MSLDRQVMRSDRRYTPELDTIVALLLASKLAVLARDCYRPSLSPTVLLSDI